MSRVRRRHHVVRLCSTLLIGLLSLIAFSAEANALFVGLFPITATTGALSITINAPTVVTLTCTSASIKSTFTNTATGVLTAPASIPLADALKNPCSLGGSPATVTQMSAWSGILTALSSGSTITGFQYTIVIPTGGLSVRTASGCLFTLGGTLAAALTTTPTSTFPFTLGTLGLTVNSTNGSIGCLGLKITPGLTATLTATYTIPTM